LRRLLWFSKWRLLYTRRGEESIIGGSSD
jgi:hypothetical protein